MKRRGFLASSCVGLGIGLAGCVVDGNILSSDQGSEPSLEWDTSEGHTEAMGGDRVAIFTHQGGDRIDTSESTIKPVHDDKGHDIDRDVSFMNHESGNAYSEGDELIIVIPESEPQVEFGESFKIEWTTDETEWYTIGVHLWGQNYRDDVP